MHIFLYIDGHKTHKNKVKILKTTKTEVTPITEELCEQCCEVFGYKPNKETLILGLIKGGKS